MAVQKSPLSLTSSLQVVHDTDSDATAETNIGPGASVLYILKVDNTANASAASFCKLYNAVGPTVGTTVPDLVLRVAGGATVSLEIPEGVSFGTGISYATVTAGGTGGITGPASDVIVDIVLTA